MRNVSHFHTVSVNMIEKDSGGCRTQKRKSSSTKDDSEADPIAELARDLGFHTDRSLHLSRFENTLGDLNSNMLAFVRNSANDDLKDEEFNYGKTKMWCIAQKLQGKKK